ncbi:MAG TPA: SRPBCC family protein [Kofleriaceae bacterium]
MKLALQQALIDRVLSHVERRTTDAEAAPTVWPVEHYDVGPAGEARYLREQTALFRELPLLVGHTSQLPDPGDFFTHDASGVPLLVSRGDDGQIHAMINVCRHRGTRVEAAPCGAKKAFVCPYHAWSYGRDGTLLGLPHERAFGPVADRNLARVPVGIAAGLIFVIPTIDRALDASAWLGEAIVDDLRGFGFESGHAYGSRIEDRELSWKLSIDVFLETYHLRPVHKDSIYPMFFDNIGLVDPHGPHLRNIFPKRSITELATRPRESWVLRTHANVLYHLFPNTLILVEPDHAAVLTLWPMGPARTRLTSFTLVPEAPATDKARGYWDANNHILFNATAEDFTMGESIQRGLASGANHDVMFGAFEHALAHFHRQVDAFGRTMRHG